MKKKRWKFAQDCNWPWKISKTWAGVFVLVGGNWWGWALVLVGSKLKLILVEIKLGLVFIGVKLEVAN